MTAADRALLDRVPTTGLAALIAEPPTGDGVMVRIPSLDNGRMRHGPCRGWPVRPDGRAPERDDPCLVVEDEKGGMWIAAWTARGVAPAPGAFIGALMPHALATAPAGWLNCDGAEVSRATYSALFAAIGTAYGAGDGITTFNVPDLRGRVPAGVDGAAGRMPNNDTLGASGGSSTHALTTAEMPSHDHGALTGIEDANHTHSGNTGTISANHTHNMSYVARYVPPVSGAAMNVVEATAAPHGSTATSTVSANHTHPFTSGTQSANHRHAITAQGDGAAHENRQPYLTINYAIYAGA